MEYWPKNLELKGNGKRKTQTQQNQSSTTHPDSKNQSVQNKDTKSSSSEPWPYEIPQILHRQWLTYTIPKVTNKLVTSWNNQVPALQNWFWTESSFKTFIMEKIPGFAKEFKYPFQKKRFNVSDTEIWRYFIMYEYGGIFSELDFELLKPIDEKILNHSCVIAQEPLVRAFLMNDQYDRAFLSNEIMLCRPRHPFFRLVSSGLFTSLSR